MSDIGTEGRDLNADSGLRSHIEAAVAFHRPSPDVDLVAQNTVEAHNAVRRARSDGKEVREFSDLRPEDRKRLQIRSAVTEVRDKASETKPVKTSDQHYHLGPPGTWSAESRPCSTLCRSLSARTYEGSKTTPCIRSVVLPASMAKSKKPSTRTVRPTHLTGLVTRRPSSACLSGNPISERTRSRLLHKLPASLVFCPRHSNHSNTNNRNTSSRSSINNNTNPIQPKHNKLPKCWTTSRRTSPTSKR